MTPKKACTEKQGIFNWFHFGGSSVEIWKDVVGYEGLYKVSNLGRVLDVESGKIRKLVHDKDGYLQLGLMKIRGYRWEFSS